VRLAVEKPDWQQHHRSPAEQILKIEGTLFLQIVIAHMKFPGRENFRRLIVPILQVINKPTVPEPNIPGVFKCTIQKAYVADGLLDGPVGREAKFPGQHLLLFDVFCFHHDRDRSVFHVKDKTLFAGFSTLAALMGKN
jgi:hypothetical protein